MEDASGCQATPFDEGVGEAVLGFRRMRVTAFCGIGWEASEVKSHSLACGRERRGKVASPGAVLGPPSIGSAVRDLPEVGPRRQTRAHLRPGSPQGRPASHCGPESLQNRKRHVQRKLHVQESNGLRMLVS